MTHVIVNGREVGCDAPVVPWEQSGLRFDGLRTRKETRAVVLHWTGGNGLAPQVYRTLRTRKNERGRVLGLSVQFVIEPNGTIYQFCDASARCQHAGSIDDTNHDGLQESANACTVGVEIVNPASSIANTRGIRRALVREEIHGVDQVATAFTAEQTASAIALTRALCAAYGLPLVVPMDGDQVLSTVMPEAEFATFRGVLGHLNLTTRKRDPGLAILRAIGALTHRPSKPLDVI